MNVIPDDKINVYLIERKTLPSNFNPQNIKLRDKGSYSSFDQEAMSDSGNTYKLIVRQSNGNPSDFSIIVGVMLGGTLFRLRRYNGNSHPHRNKLEGESFDEGFHIHKATQRYQENGFEEDGFAEKTTRYSNWHDALSTAIKDNNFVIAVDAVQRRLV